MSRGILRSKSSMSAAILAVAAMTALAPQAAATTKIWTGAAGDFLWHNVDNWSPPGIPTSDDDVLIDASDDLIITIAEPAAANHMALSSQLNVIPQNGGILTVSNGITLSGGVIVLHNATELTFSGGTQSLGGRGEVHMNNTSGSATLRPDNGTTLVIEPNITIRRTGIGSVVGIATIGSPSATAATINQGHVVAPVIGTIALVGNVVNHGLMEAKDGGVIDLAGHFTTEMLGDFAAGPGGTVRLSGTLDNTDATLQLSDDTGVLTLRGGTIIGGVISASGGGQFAISAANAGSLDGVTLATNVALPTGTESGSPTLIVKNGLTLDNAVITLNSLAGAPTLRFDGDQTLGGQGEILMTGLSWVMPAADSILTIDAGIAVRKIGGSAFPSTLGAFDDTAITSSHGLVSSQISGGTLRLRNVVNAGHIQGEPGAIVRTHFGTPFINEGTVTVEGAVLHLEGEWVNHGTITAVDSTVELHDSFTFADVGTFHRTGGSVYVRGTLENTGATFHLDDSTGSWEFLGKSAIVGGLVSTSGAASVIIGAHNVLLDGVTLATDIVMHNVQLRVKNGLTLDNATVTVSQHGGSSSVLQFDGGVQTLGGNGSLHMHNTHTGPTVVQPINMGSLAIGADIVVSRTGSGSGVAYIGPTFPFPNPPEGMTLNHGTIESKVDGRTIELRGPFANFGVVEAGNNGTLAVGATSNTAFFSTGVVRAAGGVVSIEAPAFVNLQGGVLSDGVWEIGPQSALVFPPGASFHTNAAAILLSGQESSFEAMENIAVNEGVLMVSDGREFVLADALHNIGELRGDGTLVGNVVNHGVIVPGSPDTPMRIIGDLQLTSGGECVIAAEDVVDPADWLVHLQVEGALTVASRLTPKLHDEFSYEPGVTLKMIEAATVSGTFQEVTECFGFKVVYEETSIGLEFLRQPIMGDLSCDGSVGIADLLILLGAWGPCAHCDDCPADLNDDCIVGVADLLVLLGNWG